MKAQSPVIVAFSFIRRAQRASPEYAQMWASVSGTPLHSVCFPSQVFSPPSTSRSGALHENAVKSRFQGMGKRVADMEVR
jgi:hypothetical protein